MTIYVTIILATKFLWWLTVENVSLWRHMLFYCYVDLSLPCVQVFRTRLLAGVLASVQGASRSGDIFKLTTSYSPA